MCVCVCVCVCTLPYHKLLHFTRLRHLKNIFLFKDHTNQAFFAVYDGHSGVDASHYAAIHLHHHLARNINLQKDPKLALKEAFEKTDECFVAKAKREVRSND